MSSFLPNVIVSEAVKGLGLKSRTDQNELKKKIRAGLDRLYAFQHEDGGWGWWETDQSTPFMTAYVLAGLAQAKSAGVRVDENRVRQGATWLAAVRSPDTEPGAMKAYIAYALALSGDRNQARMDALHRNLSKLSPLGVALTGLVMQMSGDRRVGEVAAELEKTAKSSDLETWWASNQDDLLNIFTDASPESTSYALKFLTQARPQSPLLARAALYLVNHRNHGYYWNSTKQTAMVIHGLTDYLRLSGELKPNLSVTVSVNDQTVLTRRFTEGEALGGASLRLDSSKLSGRNRVKVMSQGEGRLYWSARAAWYSQKSPFNHPSAEALRLNREYFRLTSTREGGKILYDLEPLQGEVKQGDLLAVKLTSSGGRWSWLMLEDPIPSGAEIVERDDLYELRRKPPWWRYSFTRREFRDDRAVFFHTYLDRDDEQFYLLKIVNPGSFRVSPARLEHMYDPNKFVTSSSHNLEVRR